MKRMLFLGALVLSVTVCTQSFGFEILDRMCGKGGKSCTSCCGEPTCGAGNGCADACEAGCAADPGCGAGNGCAAGNGCGAEPACDAGNGCCDSGCTSAPACGGRKKHQLFGGLKGLFAGCKKKSVGCTSCCGAEPACVLSLLVVPVTVVVLSLLVVPVTAVVLSLLVVLETVAATPVALPLLLAEAARSTTSSAG